MASETPRQKRITGRVMHEFKHGELKSGRRQRWQGEEPAPGYRHRTEGSRLVPL